MDASRLARLANLRWWRTGDDGEGGGARVVWLILGYVAPRQLELRRGMGATHGREIKIEACQMSPSMSACRAHVLTRKA
jgi:hypothetical protein